MHNISSRLNNLREKLIEKQLDGLLVSSSANRFYLTGWLGDNESGYLLITLKNSFLITDSRYTEEAVKKVSGFELREYGQDDNFWPGLFYEAKVKRVGFEADDLSISRLKKLKKFAKASFYQTENFIETFREGKDSQELKLIKKAIAIADKSFKYCLENLEVGMSEKQIAWEIEKFMRLEGATKNAWDPFIVASGPNSSMIHYGAGERKIKKGDLVLLDWGCFYQGYCCDISRVVFVGAPNTKQVEIYNLVLAAQKKGVEKVKAGSKTKSIDLAARNFLKEKTEYYFRHAVGHGVGIEVHELPKVNDKAKDKLEIGNIITIEPGVYIPSWGGVRIEDMYLVGEQGAKVLTKAPKKLTEVILV